MKELEAETTHEGSQKPNDAWQLMSPEDQVRASLTVTSMEQALGIDPAAIRFVVVEDLTTNTKRILAIDTSPNGQHIGKYNQIVEHRKTDSSWYTIDVEGEQIDPLASMTEGVYRAMIRDAQARGEKIMPDSVELSHQNGVPWTATLLTGEPLTDDGLIPIASYSSDKIDVVGFNPDRGGISMRVRPTVLVAELS